MKKRNKLLMILLILSLLVSILVACSDDKGETPEEAVKKAFNAVKNQDIKTVEKYFDYDELIQEYDGDPDMIKDFFESDEDVTESELGIESMDVGPLFDNLKYEILSSKVNEDIATVEAEITNINMETLMGEYMKKSFGLAMENIFEDDPDLDNEMEEIFRELLERDDNELVTSTVNINLRRNENSWKIIMDKELVDVISGGLVNVVDSLGDLDIDID